MAAAFRWRGRQTRFLLRFILVSVLMGGVGYLILGVGTPVVVAVSPSIAEDPGLVLGILGAFSLLLALGLLFGRFLPWFPAAAVDHPLGLAESWRLGRGNTWRLMWIFVIPTVECVILLEILAQVAAPIVDATELGASLTVPFVHFLLTQGIAYFGLAVTVSCVSIAFRDLTAARPAPAYDGTAA